MRIKVPLFLIILILVFALESCSYTGLQGSAPSAMMRVNHFKQTAVGVGPQLVYQVQESDEIGGTAWTYFFDEIEGLDFEPGYVYDFRVIKKRNPDPPQDASSLSYKLIKLFGKTPVPPGEQFEIRLKWGGEIFTNTQEEKTFLLNEYEIDCNEQCEDFHTALSTWDEVTGTFTHGPGSSLVLVSFN